MAGSHGVPSLRPIHVSKSQHEGKVPTFEPQEIIKITFIIIKVRSLIILCKKTPGTCVDSKVQLFARPNSQDKLRASPPRSVAM